MKKLAVFLSFMAVFLLTLPAFAQDSNEASSDSGVLMSSPTQTPESILDNSDSLENEKTDGDNQKSASNSTDNSNDALTESVIQKSTDAVMFQITANMKLTQDKIDAIRLIITDNIVKVRDLQQKLQEGAIESKAMYDQREELANEENQKLGAILTADQMKVWLNIQAR